MLLRITVLSSYLAVLQESKKGCHGWWQMLPVVTTVTLFLPCTVYRICKAVMICKCHWPIANVVLLLRDDGQSCADF